MSEDKIFVNLRCETKTKWIREAVAERIHALLWLGGAYSVTEQKFYLRTFFFASHPQKNLYRLNSHNKNYLYRYIYSKNNFISSSTVPIPAIPKLSTRTFATFGERKAGSVGPRWIFLTPRYRSASSTMTAFCSYHAIL